VTNSYFCKDLTAFHPNILSVTSIAATELAEAIADACRRAANPPEVHRNPVYIRADPYPFMVELAAALDAVLGAREA
jgi:hypothetical protein